MQAKRLNVRLTQVSTLFMLSSDALSYYYAEHIDRDPVVFSLAGKHTNCLTYFSIPRYPSQQELGVWRVVGGGSGQEGHRNGVPKKIQLMPKAYHLKLP